LLTAAFDCGINQLMRKKIAVLLLISVTAAIAAIFWVTEWQYSLPTPIPKDYCDVRTGTEIKLEKFHVAHSKPLMLHFFNPGCPCSRFNVPHIQSIIKKYKGKVDFAVVVMSNNDNLTAEEIADKFNADIPVFFDRDIATECGVYSTPQAVIIDKNSKLYYRGNYNKARYCTDKNSEYARIALDAVLENSKLPSFDQLASKAYGCRLPVCTKN
jgi:hypothetical protein